MAIAANTDLQAYCRGVAQRARRASVELASVETDAKVQWLRGSAMTIRHQAQRLIDANQRDLAAAGDYHLSDAQVDRLRLTPARIESLAEAVEAIAELTDPFGQVFESRSRPNGL